jgi:hypothetical protein
MVYTAKRLHEYNGSDSNKHLSLLYYNHSWLDASLII